MRVTLGCLSCVALLGALAAPGCQNERKLKRLPGLPAVLSGRVRIADGSRLPAYAALDLARRPLHESSSSAAPKECAAANEAARSPVQLTAESLLAGVAVAASDFTRFSDRKPRLHKVAIRGCRLRPALIVARGGDLFELENRDAYGFEPLIGPAFSARALAPGKKLRVPLTPGGVESIMCSPRAACGRTDLVVLFHPVYAITDTRGQFRIDHFPSSQLVRVTAWHPLFEPSETFVWIEPGERAAVELVLTPKERFAANSHP